MMDCLVCARSHVYTPVLRQGRAYVPRHEIVLLKGINWSQPLQTQPRLRCGRSPWLRACTEEDPGIRMHRLPCCCGGKGEYNDTRRATYYWRDDRVRERVKLAHY